MIPTKLNTLKSGVLSQIYLFKEATSVASTLEQVRELQRKSLELEKELVRKIKKDI